MKKKKTKKLPYGKPAVMVVRLNGAFNILAGSPEVRPGGDGGGNVIVVPPVEDDDDTELFGAKRAPQWDAY